MRNGWGFYHAAKRLMIRSAIIICLATLFLTLLALGQNDPPSVASSSPAMTVTDQENGKTINLSKAATLVVELASNPSTGYSWALDGDPSPLKLVNSEYKQDQSGKIGATGTLRFRFEATAAGASTLKLVYHRPWEKHVAPAKKFTLKVNVN